METNKTNKPTVKIQDRLKATRKKALESTGTTKYYNLMVGYDELMNVDIRHILLENKIKHLMLTDTYFYIKCLTKEEVDYIISLIKDVKYVFKKNGKSKKLGITFISASKYIPKKDEKDPKKNQITIDIKKKINNKTKKQIAKYIEDRKPKRKIHKINLNKSIVFEHKNPRFKSNYEKKLAKRVKLAVKYIERQEAKKAVETPKKAKFKTLQRPIQTKLKFAS